MTNAGVNGFPSTAGPAAALDARYGIDRLLSNGESCIPRWATSSTGLTATSGTVYLTFFTALQTETVTRIRTTTGGTAAGATPTVCRVGLYGVDSSGNCNLLASSANTTSLWAGTFTGYTTSMTGAVGKVAGQRYAFGLICVTGAATPTFTGASLGTVDSASLPAVAGQSDLPSSIAAGSVANTSKTFYFAGLQ